MLIGPDGRRIDYARISLTDRCRLACRYCIPDTFPGLCRQTDILAFDEIRLLIDILEGLGITKFRFTGGEPFLRKGIIGFLESLDIGGLYITSSLAPRCLDIDRINGLGIKGINISLDTLVEEKYRWLTRGGDINRVIRNLMSIKADIVRINTILIKGFNDNEITDIIDFALSIGAEPRFIEKMDFISDDLGFLPAGHIREYLQREGIIEPASFRPENSAAKYHRIKGSDARVGFIAPVSEPFCDRCSKIRVKADGGLKPCLYGASSLNLREMIRKGSSDAVISEKIRDVIAGSEKPAGQLPCITGEIMASIGG
ncbi:MAG: radical SAM protein [Elusimicrobiota bacterium]